MNKYRDYCVVSTLSEEKIQEKRQRVVDHMIKEQNRLEDEATINALRRYGYDVIKWHTYPKEKPPVGTYIVCYIDGAGEEDMEFNDYRDGFKVDDDRIYAWSECPKPFRRGE